jgi:hypothetical protein
VIISLNSINKSILVMEKYCVFFEARTEFLSIILMKFGCKGLNKLIWVLNSKTFATSYSHRLFRSRILEKAVAYSLKAGLWLWWIYISPKDAVQKLQNNWEALVYKMDVVLTSRSIISVSYGSMVVQTAEVKTDVPCLYRHVWTWPSALCGL